MVSIFTPFIECRLISSYVSHSLHRNREQSKFSFILSGKPPSNSLALRETPTDRFSSVSYTHLNDKSVVSFILSITLTGYSSAELGERMVAATVNFTNKTIQFEDLPKNLFGFDQKTTQMSILRALYFMIPSEQGTYHDSPLLKNKKSPISQGLHIPLTESYQINELTMNLVGTRKRSDTISYKRVNIDNGKVKTNVNDSIQLYQQDFEVDIPAHFITATCSCTECKSYEEWSPCRHIEVALTSIKAVSYTHLDVYKRQVHRLLGYASDTL